MRRQEQYGDPAANTYGASKMHQIAGHRIEPKSGTFEEQFEAFTPERETAYVNSKPEGQGRWELDGSNMSNSMSSHVFKEGQGSDASRSYFQGQRPDLKLAKQNQSNNDSRSQAREEDMHVGYKVNHLLQTFEGLEQKILEDVMKLAKEQNDAEDAEIARHREKINAINAQYEEKLLALRALHASHRAEFLQRESHARHQQYQQTIRDPYPRSGSHPHGYSDGKASAAIRELQQGYNASRFDPMKHRYT